MFGLSSSFVPIRVLPQTRARHLSRPINTQTRAYVTWVMDGLGCDTARSGDDGSLLKTRRDLSCPTKPMEISKLCLDRYVLGLSQIQAHCLMPCMECSQTVLPTTRPFPIPLSTVLPIAYKTSALFAHTVHPYSDSRLTLFVHTRSDGLFRIGDAAFEAKGEDIWLTNVNAGGGEESFKDESTVKLNGKPVSYDQSVKLTPGAVLEIAGKTWQLNRNTIAHA
jgi:hypothetical protein